MRIIDVTSLVVGIAGCSLGLGPATVGPESGVDACGHESAFDDRVFAALTSAEWETGSCHDDGGGLPPTCTRIRLGPDGAFSWRAVSDVVERDQSGGWNFSARSETAGIVCLETGAVIAFELDADVLRWGYLGLTRGEPLGGGGGTRDDLPPVRSEPVFGQLTATPWVKSNQFDLYRLPTGFSLVADGSYAAAYRDGECASTGSWSIDLEPRTTGNTIVFVPIADPNTCDLRGNTSASIGVSNEQPVLDDAGRLRLYSAAYRAPDATDTRPWFHFDRYSNLVGTSGTLDHALSASTPTTIDLTFTNDSELDKTLSSLVIRTTALTLTADGFQSQAPTIELATVDLTGTVLAPGASEARTVTIAPPAAAEWAHLELDLSFSDTGGSFRGRELFTTSIAP